MASLSSASCFSNFVFRSRGVARRPSTATSVTSASANNGGGVVRRYKGTAMREEKLAAMIENKVAEAMKICGGDNSKHKKNMIEEGYDEDDDEGCKVLWDEVEEVSQARAHLRSRLAGGAADPLEPYCSEHPDADECTVVDDGE